MRHATGMQLVQGERKMGKGSFTSEAQSLVGRMLGLLRNWVVLQEIPGRRKHLHLVETLQLGGKRKLMLVSCAGQQFLVGGGLESVETIVRVQVDPPSRIVAKDLVPTCE